MKDKKEIKKPNFFVVGAQRSGTTTLYYTFKKHPDIFVSPIKDIQFFYHKISKEKWTKYLNFFQNATNEKIICDVTTSYLYNKKSPYLIKERIPNPKILIQLRDPVERTISNYKQNKKEQNESLSLKQALKKEEERIKLGFPDFFHYYHASLYYSQVKRFIDVFGKKNVKITIFEEFIKNPEKVLNEIATFLQIDPKGFPQKIKKHNPGNQPLFPFLNKFLTQKSNLKELLKKFIPYNIRINYIRKIKYKTYWSLSSSKKITVDFSEKDKNNLRKKIISDIKNLEKLIGKNLNHWLPKK